MRYYFLFSSLLAAMSVFAQQPVDTIPFGGNAWQHSNEATIWFRISHPGPLQVQLLASGSRDTSIDLDITIGSPDRRPAISSLTHRLRVSGDQLHPYAAGSWTIHDTGYTSVTIRQRRKSTLHLQSLILSGAAAQQTAYVPNDDGNFFYWGRRGPSVHLNYAVPDALKVEWFYNEVTVPEGEDRIGSFFMADGFSVGYFGMQVNSASERRILFSVWSPFNTDDPQAIPDSLRIGLVRKGDGVHAGTFGAEGAGGQSYLVYPWTAGHTYRFLLRAEPYKSDPPNHTRFTAWFYAPETGNWRLIADWDRPATNTWLTHLHSFLENFEPEAGDRDRLALYANQWVADSTSHWYPLTRARFTGDNTARKGYRLDYAGGSRDSTFYLRNGGFFNQYTPLDSWFDRPRPRQTAPPVDIASPFFR
ncbi:MAG TPA: DUF3472 domain-containing protein [Puia sp.]|nr:DUF3472 domain-containing protein [Puia sp.]